MPSKTSFCLAPLHAEMAVSEFAIRRESIQCELAEQSERDRSKSRGYAVRAGRTSRHNAVDDIT